MKDRRKQIINENYPLGGMLLTPFFLGFGIYLIIESNILSVNSKEMLYAVLSENAIVLCGGMVFIAAFLLILISFVLNVIIKPKKEILYFYDIEDNTGIFINKKGKKFKTLDCQKEPKKYYYVLKTKDLIYEVLEECNEIIDTWDKEIKKSYWFNLYTPMGFHEDILLLPLLYMVLIPGIIIPGILSIIMTKGYGKIFGIIYISFPMFYLIYDLIYKLKQNKSQNVIYKLNKFHEIFYDFLPFVCQLIALAIIIILMFYTKDTFSKIMFLPFLILSILSTLAALGKSLKNTKLEKIFIKIFCLIFFTFWFGLLTIYLVKNSFNINNLIHTIPFWILGIFAFYKSVIKK